MKKETMELLFTTFLFILFTIAMFDAMTFSKLARFFPLYISVAGTALSLIYLIRQIVTIIRNKGITGTEVFSFARPLRYIGWILAYLLLIYITGLLPATAIFLFSFLILESGMTLIRSGISVIVVLVAISSLSSALGIYWPSNLLGF